MEVSLDIKEEMRKYQSDLRQALRLHQIWVGRLREDENNADVKSKIKLVEQNIVQIDRNQKKVSERLRQELLVHQDRRKARNKHVNIEYDNQQIALQLREYEMHHHSRKNSMSLLKPSVLNEIHDRSENNNFDLDKLRVFDKSNKNIMDDGCHDQSNGCSYNKNSDEMDDDSEFIHATENFSLKDTPLARNSTQDRRTNYVLKKKKQNISNSSEISKNSPSPKSSSSKSSSPSPIHVGLSPTPSPPLSLPLPQADEHLTQETFLRILGLITIRQRQILEKKRNERKKRSTTSTNKNEYVYGNFEMNQKRKKNNFSYLQQNVCPPQTRAQKMRRQQLAARRAASNASPSGSPPASPPLPWPSSLQLPSGLTIQPVPSPGPKLCTVCGQNDSPSHLIHCPRCKHYFHSSCGSSPSSRSPSSRSRSPINSSDRRYRHSVNICPECGEEIKESKTSNWTVVTRGFSNHTSSDERLAKDKIIERRLLQERNRHLTAELRKLEVRAETLKENIEASKIEKKQLISNQNNTHKRIKTLIDFVEKFKGSDNVCVPLSEKDSSRSTNYTNEMDDLSNSC